MQAVTSGANPVAIKKGIDRTCTFLVQKLRENAQPVKGTDDIKVGFSGSLDVLENGWGTGSIRESAPDPVCSCQPQHSTHRSMTKCLDMKLREIAQPIKGTIGIKVRGLSLSQGVSKGSAIDITAPGPVCKPLLLLSA